MRQILLAVLFLNSLISVAQIRPVENDTVNYRLTGFSIVPDERADQYLFEVAAGRINNSIDFQNSIFFSKKQNGTKLIATVPAFGRDYTWRVTYLNSKNKEKGRSPLYHFTTGHPPLLDSNAFRIRVIDTAQQHEDLLVFLDNPAVLCNTRGEILWYLPDVPGVTNEIRRVRDLKTNASGTITCLTEEGAFEIDYNGNRLWTAPNVGKVSGDATENYHHQFDKLANGHYMLPGLKSSRVEIDPSELSATINDPGVTQIENRYYKNVPLGTLIEYDSAGNIAWHWLSSDFFKKVVPIQTIRTKSDPGKINIDPGVNDFYFNEQDSIIYISYANISYILKIKYPCGEVLANYDGKYISSPGHAPLFSYPRTVRLAPDRKLYLYNSNVMRGTQGTSFISMFQEPQTPGGQLSKTWEFSCDIDSYTRAGAAVGGSVILLKDGSLIACTGAAGRVFIVSPDKKILWNAVPEFFSDNGWKPLLQYKVNIIEETGLLEKIIFN